MEPQRNTPSTRKAPLRSHPVGDQELTGVRRTAGRVAGLASSSLRQTEAHHYLSAASVIGGLRVRILSPILHLKSMSNSSFGDYR